MKNVYSIFVVLVLAVTIPTKAQILESDSLALVDIYEASGANWTKTWLKETINGEKVGIKGWEGITVAREEGEDFYRVTEINIEDVNNDGVYPSGTLSPSIGNLSALTLLYLNGSEKGPRMLDLHGEIPEEIWNLANLERLKMKYTSFTGGLPAGIEKMASLNYVNFQMTNLSCEIPEELFELPNMANVYMQQCNLIGAVPSTITQATKLVRLYIHDNKLTSLPFVEISDPGNAKVSIEGNYFCFSDVEPYHAVSYLKFVDNYQYVQDTENLDLKEGEQITIEVENVVGSKNYIWYKSASDNTGVDELVAEGSRSYTISSLENSETFVCKVQGEVQDFDVRAYFVVNPLGVSTSNTKKKISVNVTPNPFDNFINVKAGSEIKSIAIYNAAGNLVYRANSIFATHYKISTTHLDKGFYMLKAETSSGIIVEKLLKR